MPEPEVKTRKCPDCDAVIAKTETTCPACNTDLAESDEATAAVRKALKRIAKEDKPATEPEPEPTTQTGKKNKLGFFSKLKARK